MNYYKIIVTIIVVIIVYTVLTKYDNHNKNNNGTNNNEKYSKNQLLYLGISGLSGIITWFCYDFVLNKSTITNISKNNTLKSNISNNIELEPPTDIYLDLAK